MNIELTDKEFRRLLDLVYIGNWILNSTREETGLRTMIFCRRRSLRCAPETA